MIIFLYQNLLILNWVSQDYLKL